MIGDEPVLGIVTTCAFGHRGWSGYAHALKALATGVLSPTDVPKRNAHALTESSSLALLQEAGYEYAW